MVMNRIDGASPADGARRAYGPERKDKDKTPLSSSVKKQSSDSINLSANAKKLAENKGAGNQSREAMIEEARKRLESGELYDIKALRNAAHNLLQSDDLNAVSDED
jgi:anti-sigma28 factor (negative regulator of flagellin synthesis)